MVLLLQSRVYVDDGHLQALVTRTRRCHGVGRCADAAAASLTTLADDHAHWSVTTLGGAGKKCLAARVASLRMTTTERTEQVAIIVATELATEEVERQWIDARVDERQAVGGDLEDVPEHVVLVGVKVEPEVPDVTWQPADDEHDDKRQYETSNLLTRLHLQQQQQHLYKHKKRTKLI